MVAIAPGVQDLQADFPAFSVNGFGNHPMFAGLPGVGQPGSKRRYPALPVGGDAAGDDEAHAAPCPFGIKCRHAFEAVLGFFQAGVHAAHKHTVGQGGEAQVEGSEKMGKFGWVHGLTVFLNSAL